MTSSAVGLETLPAQTVVYAVCTGRYGNIAPRLNQMFGWLKQRGLPMAGAPGGRFPGSPDDAAASKFTWELFVPVADATPLEVLDSEQIGIKRIEAREVASLLYRGSYDTTGQGYPALMEWIAQHGYALTGSSEEWWLDDDDDVPAAELRTRIAMPVSKPAV